MLGAREDAVVEIVHGAAHDTRVGQVDGDDVEGAAVDIEERRGLSRAHALALSPVDDEALGHELGDELGDGDACEARLAGDVGAAERTGAVEGLQHERPVVRARVFGEHLARRTEGATSGEERGGRTLRRAETRGRRAGRAGGLGGRHVC